MIADYNHIAMDSYCILRLQRLFRRSKSQFEDQTLIKKVRENNKTNKNKSIEKNEEERKKFRNIYFVSDTYYRHLHLLK